MGAVAHDQERLSEATPGAAVPVSAVAMGFAPILGALGNRAVARLVGRAGGTVPFDPSGTTLATAAGRLGRVQSALIARQEPNQSVPEPNESRQEEEERYLLTHPTTGVEYALTEAEHAAVTARLLAMLREIVAGEMREKVSRLLDRADSFKILNDDNLVISSFVHAFGGEGVGTATMIADEALAALTEAEAGVEGDDLAGAAAAVESAEAEINDRTTRMNDYVSRVFEGGADVITLLQITQTAAWAVFSVAGGAVLVSVGVNAIAASAAAGGASGFLQSTLVPRAKDDVGSSADPEEWLKEAAGQALVQGLGGLAGGVIAERIGGLVINGVYTHFGAGFFGEMSEEAAKVTIKNMIEGSLGEAIEGAVADGYAVYGGRMTWGDLAQNVVTNLVAGGIGGKIQGHVKPLPGKPPEIAPT